jgi:glycosyltransferase involved in cell wall biosynthesis
MESDKKIAILYIITKLELGGAQKVCLSLFNGLAQQDVTTFLLSGSEGLLAQEIANNPNAILIDTLKREVSWKFVWYELKNFFTLIKKIRTLKKQYPELIVHTHSTKAGIVGRWAAFFARVKQRVHTVHGFAFHNHQSKLIWWVLYIPEWFTSFITSHFVCVSSADVQTGIKLFPRFAKKHSIIRAAVDWEQFTAATTTDFPADTFVFGTIACFKPQKNMFDLLQAFAYVHAKQPHTKLEIIGDGAQRPALEAWIAERNLEDVIILHGWQNLVAPFMLQWNAFVLSSLWEGLPCAIIEARLLKLPVIAYDTGGIRDVIEHGKNGFLCKQQWQDLAQEMLNLSLNKTLYAQMHGHPDALGPFHNDFMVMRHKELYKNLLHHS